ncbi:MAG: DNA repair ATPase [Sedimentisphaerales bacterium]|nr:DNA repair ATPase [Sedimentisphaerales bacterium]
MKERVVTMADNDQDQGQQSADPIQLEGGTYEVIRHRLGNHGEDLRQRLDKLNASRKEVFGAIESKLIASERISTQNNCVPRDMVPVGDSFIFGYNVFVGLRTETVVADVFAVYRFQEGSFIECGLELIADERFEVDFKNLYKYYRNTVFSKFAVIGHHLFMVFQVGKDVTDVKTFKWLIREGRLQYLDNRSDHEFVYPPQHEFEWIRTTQDMHRRGLNPHISIEDRIFVETVGGDLTIKIEDNTASGEGIYSEPVDNADQTLNDAEIYYAIIGNVIALKIRPYQEPHFRYILYSEKTHRTVRIDSIRDACVLLPEDHGLVFPRGYFLQTGDLKQFDIDMQDMVFEKRISSPNGEDYLYIFYHRRNGVYVLLLYNLIEQKMSTPLVCNGYSFFEDGTLIYFRADGQAQKHHVIQIWTTSFYGPDYTIDVHRDSPLYKIGNKPIVRCMAESMELLNLIGKEESYANLYMDIARKAEAIRDAYFWIGSADVGNLAEPLGQIRAAAAAAIDEYEKVVRTRQNTRQQIAQVKQQADQIISSIDYDQLETIRQFVDRLSQLRAARGQVVSLKDLRYADLELVEQLEELVAENTDRLSMLCVEFLLEPASLDPYQQRVAELKDQIGQVEKVAQAKELQEQVAETGRQLEMLTEIVSNLKIADATQTVAIIDNISLVYSKVNQVKAALKNRTGELAAVEGRAEFASQLKLIDQSVINYLDVCDTPAKCDEYLTKVTVQMETMESRFADFDEFIVQLAEKREELYNAFESRKVQLVAARNQRASALMTAAERVLKGIENRVRAFEQIAEINGYFASDLMVERVRDSIGQLQELGDSVKAEDIKGRLKTLQQDAIRQLKDRQALYEDGENIIRLGSHKFSVNRQALEGTIVRRDEGMFYHLTGTGFFESITDEAFLATKDVWGLELPSESADVYRGEYLAYVMLEHLESDSQTDPMKLLEADFEDVVKQVQMFMGPRYDEGYIKGVHDHDAARILLALIEMKSRIDLLRYPAQARALAAVFWMLFDDAAARDLIAAGIDGAGRIRDLFAGSDIQDRYIKELASRMEPFVKQTDLFDPAWIAPACEYLFYDLSEGKGFIVSGEAVELRDGLLRHLSQIQSSERFEKLIASVSADPLRKYRFLREWTTSYIQHNDESLRLEYVDEVAALLMEEQTEDRLVINEPVQVELGEMTGSHPCIDQGRYVLNFCQFMTRLQYHRDRIVPRCQQYARQKKELLERYDGQLRLREFQPRVLTTFVRNKLIDKVYLPLLGDNLAKQIGTADTRKRTDRQGLLLLISPPGYGKTTLMEYIANRLGLIFMKINGPAIGHRVTSFDPSEASNAAAREELNKLNLAFEMGDNVMIYVDDIQHTHPEFLQKFISLCDAQRRVEGVFRGRTRTYDLRGKRVCVVMAGNPYTESGEKFKIPDMLSNRADTYNIGDIVGDNYDEFVMSYVENCLTSNPIMETLAQRGQNDVYEIIKLTETGQQEGLDLEGNYSVDELNEYVATMKKLFTVRQVVLRVNQEYIRSAGMAEEYRTEPAFLLQGSYRNMNRIASRVLPVMNDRELWTLILSAYEQDAQTLTTGAESNLLKFRELTGQLTEEQAQRWDDIKKTFQRNQLLGGDSEDKVGKIIRQLNAFSAGLGSIKDVIAEGITTMASTKRQPEQEHAGEQVKQLGREVLDRMNDLIDTIRQQQKIHVEQEKRAQSEKEKENTEMLVSVLEEQFRTMETWLTPVHRSDADRKEYFQTLVERFEAMVHGYTRLIEALQAKYEPIFQDERTRQAENPEQPKQTRGRRKKTNETEEETQ